jgi:hypothetical protein
VRLIQFLLNRGESKGVLLGVCRQMLTPGQQSNLTIISQVYDMLNQVYKSYLETEAHLMVSGNDNNNNDMISTAPDLRRGVLGSQPERVHIVHIMGIGKERTSKEDAV